MKKPVLSIIINNYNYLRYLPRCVDSLLQQTDSDFELMIVDDGSADGSWDYISSLPERVIKIRTNRLNQAGACLYATKQAKGSFVHFLDADDYLLPAFVSTVKPYLARGLSSLQVQLVPVDTSERVIGNP